MNKHNYSKQIAGMVVTLCAFAIIGSHSAQAGANRVNSPSDLVNPVTTAQYPVGNTSTTPPGVGVVPASFNVAAGSNTLTFTATKPVAGSGFRSFAANSSNAAPQFTMAPFGMAGDIAEDTSFDNGPTIGNTATAPLRIDFQQGVTGFGLLAQDFNQDTETFTLNVFNGAAQIGTFTFGPAPNGDPIADPGNPLGNAVFVGAQTTFGDVITSATLSSLSFATTGGGKPNNGNNDFVFGRTQVNAPVPEASTVVSFGMGVLLFAGLALGARKRKVHGPQAAG